MTSCGMLFRTENGTGAGSFGGGGGGGGLGAPSGLTGGTLTTSNRSCQALLPSSFSP